jgi:hypothetical protein
MYFLQANTSKSDSWVDKEMTDNNNGRVSELKQQIGKIFIKIILELRPEKNVIKEDFETLYVLLEELKLSMQNETVIDKKYIGLLFFFYQSIIVEASHCNYSEHIMQEVWKISKHLILLLDEDILSTM